MLARIFISVIFFFLCCNDIKAQSISRWKIDDLEKYFNQTDSPLVINFWATYCGPCLKEIPKFEEVINKYKNSGIKMLLVSLDFKESYPDKIRDFSKKYKYNSKIVWLDETNADYFCPRVDINWSGVMPATLLLNNKFKKRSFFEEEMTTEKFESALNDILTGQ